jgi:catechol 2,3-dioxygenase-like lactoylglutathione lyase family enzyme
MIRHIASIAEIVEDIGAAVQFYEEILGLQVDHEGGSGYATIEIPGILHFGVWDRDSAAEMTFGDRERRDEISLGFSIGFEVDRIEGAVDRLEAEGWDVLQHRKTEPWGQVTSRFTSPSGALCEFSELPTARRITQSMIASEESGTGE